MAANLVSEFIHLLRVLDNCDRPNGNHELTQGQLISRLKELGSVLLVDRLGRPDYAVINVLETKCGILFDQIYIDPIGCLQCFNMNTPKGFVKFTFEPEKEIKTCPDNLTT